MLHKLFFRNKVGMGALFLEEFDLLTRFNDLNNIVENMYVNITNKRKSFYEIH